MRISPGEHVIICSSSDHHWGCYEQIIFYIIYIVFHCVVKDLLINKNRISVWILLETCQMSCHSNVFWNILSFCLSPHILHPELARCSSVPRASILFEYSCVFCWFITCSLFIVILPVLFILYCVIQQQHHHYQWISLKEVEASTDPSGYEREVLSSYWCYTFNIFTYIFQDWPKL